MNEFLISGSEKFFFWMLKHLNKKLLKKYFPFIEEDLHRNVQSSPRIYISEKENHCSVSFNIGLKNYTNYDLYVYLMEIDLLINDYRFIKYEKPILKNFKKKEGTNFYLDIPITFYQVRKILQMVSAGGNLHNAKFELKINAKNIYGDITLNRIIFAKIEVIHVPN